jgi:hypothetical protein
LIDSMFASAPAGVLGSGSVDARPYACAAVRPSLVPVAGVLAAAEGTRVPFAGTDRRRGTDLAGTGVLAALPAMKQHDPITQNDGTTLGNHSRGRPKS